MLNVLNLKIYSYLHFRVNSGGHPLENSNVDHLFGPKTGNFEPGMALMITIQHEIHPK